MLLNLHVKNLAIIEEEEIEFGKGLNILSGETGAGKSIILGALGLAMGDKPSKGLIRDESKEALAEAIFSVNNRQKSLLKKLEIEAYDDEVILQRKITPTRTTAKINGESVPAGKLAEVANILIDIYGQHEQQTLLSEKNHILLLDDYAKEELKELKEKLSEAYDIYKSLLSELYSQSMDESEREREIGLLKHEISEIEAARLAEGEDEKLKEEYRVLSKTEKIMGAIKEAKSVTDGEITESIGRAIRSLRSVEDTDSQITSFIEALSDAENILSEAKYSLSSYEENLEMSPARLLEVSDRIDLIDSLKRKYSKTGCIEDIFRTLEENKTKLQKFEDYESYILELSKKIEVEKEKVYDLSSKIRYIRIKSSLELTGLINEALKDLNFFGDGLEIILEELDEPKRNGMDEVSFYISTNPGEPSRPLKDIASGGELSRIMLAIKTIFAGSGEIDTLVFDEIDSGVSGKTAARVASRLSDLSRDSQIICITHLPQIAAKADCHYLIEKITEDNKTVSSINPLNEEERIKEVARMLAGDNVTPEAIDNAKMLMNS